VTRKVWLSAIGLMCGVLLGSAEGRAQTQDNAVQPPAQMSPVQADAPPTDPAQAGAAQPDSTPANSTMLPAAGEPIGNVATVSGSATLSRFGNSTTLKVDDDIYLGDTLQTGADGALGITFNDATTFNLSANSNIVVDNFVYEDGGKKNSALFNVARGTVAFVASAVAKTGDMKITTPTATLGIRGTTGVIEVPDNAAPGGNDVAIKLYPDQDGRVGRIEVHGRDGARLGLLSQAASGFAVRAAMGGRFIAAPLQISAQQAMRDRGFVRQLHASQGIGRQIVTRQRELRQQNFSRQPGMQQRPGLQQRQPNMQRQPGQPNMQRPGQQQPNMQRQPGQPRQPNMRQPGQPTTPGNMRPGATQPPGTTRPSGTTRPGAMPSHGARTPGGMQPGTRLPGGIQQPGTRPSGAMHLPNTRTPGAIQPPAIRTPGAIPQPHSGFPSIPGLSGQRLGIPNIPGMPRAVTTPATPRLPSTQRAPAMRAPTLQRAPQTPVKRLPLPPGTKLPKENR